MFCSTLHFSFMAVFSGRRCHLVAGLGRKVFQLSSLGLGQVHHLGRELRKLCHVDAEGLVAWAWCQAVQHGQPPRSFIYGCLHVLVGHAYRALHSHCL